MYSLSSSQEFIPWEFKLKQTNKGNHIRYHVMRHAWNPELYSVSFSAAFLNFLFIFKNKPISQNKRPSFYCYFCGSIEKEDKKLWLWLDRTLDCFILQVWKKCQKSLLFFQMMNCICLKICVHIIHEIVIISSGSKYDC